MIRTKLSWYAALAVSMALAGCGGGTQAPPAEKAEAPAASAPAAPVDPATAGTITGKVSFEGTKPVMPRIHMESVPACTEANKEPVLSQEVEVNDNGTLRDVYVYVKEGLGDRSFPVPTDAVTLEQKGCQYHPHVVAIMAGQKFVVKNDDPTNHNIHPLPQQNREWNQSQPPGAAPIEQTFARPEVMIPVKCNVHPWMKAYIGVQKSPFAAVTGTDGTYTITGLPPGDYTVETWQEKYGTQTQKVTVAPKETKTLDFSYKG